MSTATTISTHAAGVAPRETLEAAAQAVTAIAMSGGVDSSAAAAILHQRGHKIIGLTMQLWNHRRLPELANPGAPAPHRCCSIDDVYDARRVAAHLNFPFYVVNFERQFEEAVVRPFVDDYLHGRTPIPCTACNNQIKFDELLTMMREAGAEHLATGHYARVRHNPETGRHELFRARDEAKDQSYFLFGLKQEQLARVDFPLGEMSKDQVREIARAAQLPVAEKPESQEICFVPTGNYVQFIESYLGEQGREALPAPGEIVTIDGEVVGTHQGLHRYTVGQRRGLGIATGRSLYVVALDQEKNQLIVGDDHDLWRSTCLVRDVNWIAFDSRRLPASARATVKIRHRHEPGAATITPIGENSVRIDFDAPQRAITPGQSAVFYDADLVLGGGWITS